MANEEVGGSIRYGVGSTPKNGLLSNFFETENTAHRYLRRQPELSGFSISIPGAIKVGRTVFADLMKEP